MPKAPPAPVVIPARIETGGKVYSEVFAWGQCGQGQFGLGAEVLKEGKKLEPTAIDELQYIHIKALGAAPEHTVVAATGGEAYSCGNCDNGKLGHKTAEMDEMDDVFEGSSMHRFCMMNALKQENMSGIEGELMGITCGREFTCAWTTGGHVYTWGEGSNGKLCHQDNNSKKLPHKISALREKKVPAGRAACGYDHILLITSSADYGEVGKEFGVTIAGGLVMAAGANNGGQLGTNDPNARPQWTPQMLDPKLRSNMDGSVDSSTMFGGASALQVAAGQMHSMCRAGGKVWTWGFGADGQLGHEKPPPIPGRPAFMQPRFTLLEPKHVEGITKMVVEVACGANFSMALCDDGSVFTWGKNDKGQLGLGDTAIHEQPVKVVGLAGKGVKKLCGGECHAIAMVSGGEVYSWGAGNMGQLGLGEASNTNEPRLVPGLKGMTDIAASGNVSWAWRNIEAPPAAAKKRKADAPAAADAKKPKKAAAKKKK